MGLFVCFLVLVLTDPSPPLRVHSWSSPTPLLLSAFIPVLVGPQVDLPAALAKTEWGALVRPSTKWSEKKQAIDIAVAAIGATPKLKVQKSARCSPSTGRSPRAAPARSRWILRARRDRSSVRNPPLGVSWLALCPGKCIIAECRPDYLSISH